MGLEDDFCDIIKKARHGQSLTLGTVAQHSHISKSDLEVLEKGTRLPSSEEVDYVAQALNLRSLPLTQISIKGWLPNDMPAWVTHDQLVMTILGDIGGYEVKGYLLTDPTSKESLMIDTGYNAKEMLATLRTQQFRLKGVCLTHGHTDHAGGLDEILKEWPVPVYLGEGDVDLLDWTPPQQLLMFPKDKDTVQVGSLTLECLATPGHTPGGFCYSLKTNSHQLCFVGDTLFAGSVGRSNPFSLYPTHLSSVRDIVLKHPDETVLLPGHGPATTVLEERDYNPFA